MLDFIARLALMEELADLPYGTVWAEFCARTDAPTSQALIADLDAYQTPVADR